MLFKDLLLAEHSARVLDADGNRSNSSREQHRYQEKILSTAMHQLRNRCHKKIDVMTR
jgi:hypothetical protein